MSLFIGRSNQNHPYFHITNTDTGLSAIKDESVSVNTLFSSKIPLYKIVHKSSIPYYDTTYRQAKRFVAPFDVESLYLSTNTMIFIIIRFGSSYFLDLPPEQVMAWNSGAKGCNVAFKNSFVAIFSNSIPDEVILIKTELLQVNATNQILINKNTFSIDGINFSDQFISFSSSPVVVTDTNYLTSQGYFNLHNSGASNVGWFLENQGFGRFDSSGNKNYFAKVGVSNFKQFHFLGSGANSVSFSQPSNNNILVVARGLVIDEVGNGGDGELVPYTSMFYLNTSDLNAYRYIGRYQHYFTLPMGSYFIVCGFRYSNGLIKGYYAWTPSPYNASIPITWTEDTTGNTSFTVYSIV